MVLELLLTDMPAQGPSPYKRRSELDVWAGKLGVAQPRYPQRHEPPPDLSHPAMSVNLDACIQCGRCVRACREEQVNDVIGYAWRGEHARSSSTSTTRWAPAPASPAASACRPARPAR